MKKIISSLNNLISPKKESAVSSDIVSQADLPEQFSQPLSLEAANVSISDIRALTLDFQQWQKDIFPNESVVFVVKSRAAFVDLILAKLWHQHGLNDEQATLLAVGGYGRGELHPYSDVDILILTSDKISRAVEEKISAFITILWDVKLDIGHSVRSVKECLKQAVDDVTIATNLMEMRPICGDQSLSQSLQPLLNEDVFWTSEKFFIAKRDEQTARHQQYHGVAYTLEPNLKATPGGLRDIQTIGWVAKRHFKADSLEELVEHGYLSRNEFFELLECQDYLWRMRCALHFVAGRSENRLLFDYQGDVATLLGLGDGQNSGIERMMKRFFRIIGRIGELNDMLLHHFEQAILKKGQVVESTPINNDFVIYDGKLKAVDNRIFMRSIKIMEMFLIIAKHPQITGLHPETQRMMRNARRRLVSGMQDYAKCREMFLEIIKHPRGLGLPFTLMHKHSIIAAYLPEWGNIVGQMQFDLFHAYSVDEHSYRLVKNLYRFSQVEHNHEYPLCSKIVQRIRKPELLYLAGIFHDIAKGRGGDHAKLGAVDALNFSKMHGLSDHDGRMIAWLVKHHLLMSVTAQRRDIADENVITEFANIVRDEAHLDYLYCLTVADMRATNESLWNSWKANLLQELYYSTKRAFRRGLEKPVDLRAKIRENQQNAHQLLIDKGINETKITALWNNFKADYFLRHSPEQIAWHSENILNHDQSKPLVLVNAVPYRGGTELFVYTRNKANIFANIVTLLGSKKLSIHDAKIINSKNDYTLNTFVILDQQGKPINDHDRARLIAESLTAHLSAQTLSGVKEQAMPQRLNHFDVKTKVTFIEKASNKNRTVLEISALDYSGLLASFAQVFQACKIHIHSAKITTFGERAEDVFTVSNDDNQALTPEQQQELTQKLCSDAIEQTAEQQ